MTNITYNQIDSHLRYVLKTPITITVTKLFVDYSMCDAVIYSCNLQQNNTIYNVFFIDLPNHIGNSLNKIVFANNVIFIMNNCRLINNILFYPNGERFEIDKIANYFDSVSRGFDLMFRRFDEPAFLFDSINSISTITTNIVGNNYYELIDLIDKYKQSFKTRVDANSISIKLINNKYLLFNDKHIVKLLHDNTIKFAPNRKFVIKLLSTIGGLYEYKIIK